MAAVEFAFRAMGGEARLIVSAPTGYRPALFAAGAARILELESRWTRFDPTSDIRRLDASAGEPLPVSADTRDVVGRAVEAWLATGGRFDPTVRVADLGYDRSFALVQAAPGPARAPVAAPGCAGVVVDEERGTVSVPAGVRLDLGAIGKGRAADLTADLLMARGARGVCVDLGGDLRMAGQPPGRRGGWVVSVEDPRDPAREIARLAVDGGGAVATSSVLGRAWRTGDRAYHHVVDPATGQPATGDVVAVTVVAGEAWWAEALAMAALVAGHDGEDLLAALGAPALLVEAGGGIRTTAALDAHLV